MSTPYVTPQMLIDAPLGISWQTIPSASSSAAQQKAEQMNIAIRATALVDEYCEQPLRATVDVERLFGPDFRLTLEPNGVAHALMSRWPIIDVLSARVSPSSAFPRTWRAVPVDQIDTDESLMPLDSSTVAGAAGAGASGLYIAPGYVDGGQGRRGWVLEATYINGWPHAGLTADAVAGAVSIEVDDITGFTGAVARVYDGSETEMISVASTSGTSGPGTLTLSSPLASSHDEGIVISTLPGTVQQATLLYAAHIALERGTTAINIPDMDAPEVVTKAPDFATEAEILLHGYKRVI